MQELSDLGVVMDQVTSKLQQDGVASFAQSFRDLLSTIEARRIETAARVG
jgi:transaldolase